MMEYNRNVVLPEIQLPTEDGKLLELPDFTEEHGEFEEEEDMDNEIPEVSFTVVENGIHLNSIWLTKHPFFFISFAGTSTAATATADATSATTTATTVTIAAATTNCC